MLNIHSGRKTLTRQLCLLLLATLVAFWAPFFASKNNAKAQDADYFLNEYIFQVMMLPSWRISEAIFAYEVNGKYYLPFQELAEGFEFFSEMDYDARLIQGFASKEENSFTFDAARNEVILSGKREIFPPDSVLNDENLATQDIYVELELLNKIWPVEMHIDLSTLNINVTPEEELSFVRNKERKEKQESTLARKERAAERRKVLPPRENPYQILGKPTLDLQAVYEFETKDDELTGSNIINGTQNIGKMHAEFAGTFKYEDQKIQKPDSIRLKFSRKSIGEEILLVQGLRNVEFGDVNIRQRQLIDNSASGRGFTISNDNKDRSQEFDRVTIRGTGPSGWEIELYNNDELIEVSAVPDDGEYVFEDVILNYGNNNINIILFGPQGQIREETRQYTAGSNMLPKGKFRYNLGLLDSDRRLILLDNEPRTSSRGVVKNLSTAYGLNNRITLFSNYTETPIQNNDDLKKYFTGGASLSLPVGLLEAEVYNELQGGHAVNLDYVTRFLGIRTNLRLSFLNNFESSFAGISTTKKKFEGELQLNKNLRVFNTPIGLRLRSLHTERDSGLKTTDFTFSQSFSKSGIRLSHSNTLRFTDGNLTTSNGSINSTIREGKWQLRSSLAYVTQPIFELTTGTMDLRYNKPDSYNTSVNLSHNFQTSDYKVGGQFGYDFGHFVGSLETSFDRNEEWRTLLRLTSSFHPYTSDDNYTFSSRSYRSASPVHAQVFLDHNNDGIFDEDDTPIENAKINIGQSRSREKTGENGEVITFAPANKVTNVSLDAASLEDPYYIPATEGFSYVPIKGKMIKAVLPVIETGSIDGTVLRASSDLAAAGVVVILKDLNGKETARSETGFDGYYTFEYVPPGQYYVVAAEEFGLDLIGEDVVISNDELFVYGNDLYVDDLDYIEITEGDSKSIDQINEEQNDMKLKGLKL